jgi:hypothetical protein
LPPQLQLDKATADAAEFKAGFDKAVHDNFEQKAQVGAAANETRRFCKAHGLWKFTFCSMRACGSATF